MHMKNIYSIVFFVIIDVVFTLCCFAENQSEHKSDFIIEYKTNNEELVNTIYGEKEIDTKEAKSLGIKGLEQVESEKVNVKYPKVVMINDKNNKEKSTELYLPNIKSIKFLDEKGNTKKEMSIQKHAYVYLSKNKMYICINTPSKIGEKGTEETKNVIVDDNGKILWSVKGDIGRVGISPNGKYVVADTVTGESTGSICIYYEGGKLVKKIEKYSIGWDIDFSIDGEFFAMVIQIINWKSGVNRHVDKYSACLLVCDEKGVELCKKENIAKGDASICKVKVNNENVVIIRTGDYKLFYYDRMGGLIKQEQSDKTSLKNFKIE